MEYVMSITTSACQLVRILDFYLTLGRIRISILGLNPGFPYQGPVVQNVVSLTSSLRVILLTVLADSVYNTLIFFAKKCE